MLDAQVMIPSSVDAALVSARISLSLSLALSRSLSLLSAAAIHHPASFPALCEAIRVWHTSRSQTWSPKDRSTWTVETLQSINEATRMKWMRTIAFNWYLFPLIEDGEREAKCVETACKMFGAMWTADAEEVEHCDKSMTILCDMLAAWKLLEVLRSMDTTLLDEEVWTELAAIPLRAKMSSKTMAVLVAIHVEDSSFYKARLDALTNARNTMQTFAASSAEDKVSIQSLETDGSDENMIRLDGAHAASL